MCEWIEYVAITINGHNKRNIRTDGPYWYTVWDSSLAPWPPSIIFVIQPSFININKSFSLLLKFKHFLGIFLSQNQIDIRICLNRESFYSPVREIELILENLSYPQRRHFDTFCNFNLLNYLLGIENYVPGFNYFKSCIFNNQILRL